MIMKAHRSPLLSFDEDKILDANRDQSQQKQSDRVLGQQDDIKDHTNVSIDWEEAIAIAALKTKELIDHQN